MASSIWSIIKAAAPTFSINTSAPAPDPEHQQKGAAAQKQRPADKPSSHFSNSISRVLGSGSNTITPTPLSPIPPSLPRSTSSPGEFQGSNQSQILSSPTTAHPPLPPPTRKHSSRLSLSFSAGGQKEKEERKERGKVREKEAENNKNAEVIGDNTAAADGTGTVGVSENAPTASPLPSPNPAFDPLSQQIFMRRNTEHSIPRRSMHMEGIARTSSDFLRAVTPSVGDATKDKSKKGGSFLSRLSIRGGRKKELGDLDSDSELGAEARMDGTNARVFSQTISNPVVGGGYVPRHKEPPRYIRTKASNKRTREFNRMFLAQELIGTKPPAEGAPSTTDPNKAPVVTVSVVGGGERKTERSGGAIWATEFSRDGKYLATAGRDHVVRVWAVITTPEERRAHEDDEASNGGAGERLSAPVFRDQPIAEFEGHTGEVLDLSWSKNNFLLSSSMDKTVRLWHLSRPECLCTFKHKDFVTRLAFHPCDDRFFLAGSLDTMLRLWSIPDKAVAFSVQLPDLVTAVAFSPDGKTAIAGLLNGLCLFFETEGLKQRYQIHVRSSRGKNAKGSKITGIQTMIIPPPSLPTLPSAHAPMSSAASHASTDVPSSGEVRVLITSNDSRIRIYNLKNNSLELKLKGLENSCSQIAASFSDDGKYVICGSEDRKAFVWSLASNDAATTDKDKSPCEYFEAHGEIVTTAVFAPTKTRMLLGQSGDPLYDLCNPPPVVLQSLDEVASAAASQIALSTNGSHIAPTPSESLFKKPEPSPAYIARSRHYDGNIIITTGDTGIIKVFRQDCAFPKRRHESWETGSTFSRKLTAPKTNGLGRSISVMTRTSAGSGAPHSRRGSISQSIVPGSAIGSPQLGAVGANSDRILSWRQGIEDGADRRSSAIMNRAGSVNERSVSPSKGKRTPLGSTVNLPGSASEARKQPYANSITTTTTNRNRAGSTLTSPTASVFSNTPSKVPSRVPSMFIGKRRPPSREEDTISAPPTPSFIFRSASGSENEHPLEAKSGSGGGGGGTSFWSLNKWRGITGFKASSSSHQGSQEAVNPGRKSTGSCSSLTKRRDSGDGTSKEKIAEKDDKVTRRQSTGLLPAAQVISDDERRSLSTSAKSQDGIGDVKSDIMSIPTDGARGMISPMNPVQMRRDASPYRHLWSRGTTATSTSHASQMNPDLNSDVIGEGVEDESEEETTCKGCGSREFKAKKIEGKQRLSCGRCGKVAEL